MPDEKPYKYENVPIPSYEEATSSRAPTPALSPSNEPSQDEERQGLLGSDPGGRLPVPTRRAGYRPPPTDEGDRDRESLDELDYLDAHDGRGSTSSEEHEVRREMEQMEVMDPPAERSIWGKRISSISQSLHLRFEFKLPDWVKLPKWNMDLLIVIIRVLALLLIMGIVYMLFVSKLFTGAVQRMTGQMYDPESVRIFVQEQVDSDIIRDYLQHITAYDHVAGTEGDYALSQWVEGMFAKAGLEQVWVDEYYVYLNYPKYGGRAVELLDKDGKWTWRAQINEDQAYPDAPRQQTMVFHGHSASGDVQGPLVYANYGSREDFQKLHDSGIETTGAIALVKYYGSQGDRALKVKAAEEAGFIGCIIYSDPAEDGFLKGEVWPKGRYMPADGVQRGAVSLMSWVIGDVLTPGWASTKGVPRLKVEDSPGLNKIPSLPLSWRDAQPLLQALRGFGDACPPEWQGGVPDVEWWTGNLSSPIVHLKNEQDEIQQQPIWNVMGRIMGVEQPDKVIIVGNHRDAWAFGAADPGSGTAVLLEMARIFGMLVERGWRPLRTIVFASWDAEEYNLIGSTEYVEDNLKELRENAYAYINVDVAVEGSEFRASASPILKKALLRVLDRTSDPNLNVTLRSLWDQNGGLLPGLGAGSDYVAFQDMAGTSSIDMGFVGEPFPYHSVYDNFEWMERFGDPGFQYHRVLGQVWALLLLEMCNEPLSPLDLTAYSSAVTRYVMDLQRWIETRQPAEGEHGHPQLSIEPLRDAALQFNRESQEFERWEEVWTALVYANNGFESGAAGEQRRDHNNKKANFETDLLDLEWGGGLPGRDQFKHILFAPQAWSGYDEAYFPAIRDAVEAGDWPLAQNNIEKAAAILKAASAKLLGQDS
ncbi:MAG: hypothetical protein M1818_005491 [Claussenomyces sp. TS43310]|nr:MAG: hypothetical protein M1818_005491 [Claussenomyces sp. TS43310]